MCVRCGDLGPDPSVFLHSRHFVAAAAAALAFAAPAWAAEDAAPPKPRNVIAPDEALKRLMAGNTRYVSGVAKRHDFAAEREALSAGQNPYAGILSCADSRIAPEYAFDAGRGDLFVVRVAGNFLNDDNLASFEYAVAVLHTPLLMVLGHAACGAIDATIKSLKDGTTLPGHLPALVERLASSVKAVAGQPGDELENATKENVRANVERMKRATPLLSAAVESGSLKVVGGYYNLHTGRVDTVS